MTGSVTAGVGGSCVAVGLLLILVGVRGARSTQPPPRWSRAIRAVWRTTRLPGQERRRRRARLLLWCGIGVVVWVTTTWPAAALAVWATGMWAPWLLGSARVVRERLDRLEAVEGWCRRMADVLSGGGAMGMTQAIAHSANHVDDVIGEPVRRLAVELRDQTVPAADAMRRFADALDDRITDTVAAALLLALQQQSVGVARVLRLLADGVARDVRARREIEAARAESRQSIRMLLVIQAGVLAMLAAVPTFAAPYASALGQVVMAALLAATLALLVWMRRLAVGVRAPRILGSSTTATMGPLR